MNNNSNQTENNQNVQPNEAVNNVNNTNTETSTPNQTTTSNVNPGVTVPNATSTTVVNNKPQVVQGNDNIKEVNTVSSGTNNSTPNNSTPTPNSSKKKKSGHPVFLVLLLLFLFAFVFFLPEITNFVTNYKNEVTGNSDLKSGTMTCKMNLSTDNINYEYTLTFRYTENKLKSSSSVTTSRLADSATDSNILTEKQNDCLALKETVDNTDVGMNTSCDVSAAMQRTTQEIDYEKLDLDYISTNIAEFGGFYPEYELDQSARAIENELTGNGYTCEKNEY